MGNEPSKSRALGQQGGAASAEPHAGGVYAGPPPLQHAPEGAVHGTDAHSSKNAVVVRRAPRARAPCPRPSHRRPTPTARAAQVPDGAEVIGNYLVEHIIGKGSFAEVKLGRNIKTGEQVRALVRGACA
jgi:hypothetical protein